MKRIFVSAVLSLMAIAAIAIFFVPAFRGEVSVSPGLNIAGLEIHFYSVLVAIGIYAGYSIARSYALKKGIDEGVFDATALAVVLVGFVGAKVFYIAGSPSGLSGRELREVWTSGFAFYGGLFGGLLVLLLARMTGRFRLLTMLDALALGLPVGQAIGRLGNFFNQEAYGFPTRLPWKMYIEPAYRWPGFESFDFFHPTFLYEILGLLLLFTFLWYLSRRSFPAGRLFAVYAVVSGLLRVFLEELRVDALLVDSLKISQLTAILLAVTGALVLIYTMYNARKTS